MAAVSRDIKSLELMEKNQSLAVKLALITVFFWSTVATAFKLALTQASPMQVVIISSFTSTVVLALIYFFQNNKDNNNLTYYFKQSPKRYLLAGTINPVLYYWVLFAAYDKLPAQVAQSINYTWAIVLSLLAVPILKQRFTKGDMIGLGFCYAGVFTVVTRLEFSSLAHISILGVILALLSTVLWASYWLANTKLKAPPVTSLLLCFLCATPSLLVLVALNADNFNFTIKNSIAGIYVGLFEMSLAFVFWLKAMRVAQSTAQISSLIYISPFLSLVFIYFILGEPIYTTTLVGLAVICVGLVLQKKINKAIYG